MRRLVATTATLVAMATLVAAQAAAGAPADETLRTRSLAATCAQCHGTDGRAVSGALVPPLAGMDAATLVARMAAFKTGAAPSTVMEQLAKGYSDAQIRALAAYFAGQPR